MGKRILSVICPVMLLFFAGCVSMDQSGPAEEGYRDPQQELVESAAAAVKVMCEDPDNRSLNVLIDNARGVLIYPRLIRAGALLGGEGGRGVLVAKSADGNWSSPAFYVMGGGSMGFQIGMQRASVIIVFMNDRVLHSAIRTGVTVGADASVSAGSAGADFSASSQTVYKDIYYFSSVEGLFAGISLEGQIINADHPANRNYYGENAAPEGILLENRFENPGAAVLKDALNGLQ
ncbi:MAG: lipid-binding SYLF domain-containing protein [Desulfobacterales bacterium]